MAKRDLVGLQLDAVLSRLTNDCLSHVIIRRWRVGPDMRSELRTYVLHIIAQIYICEFCSANLPCDTNNNDKKEENQKD